MMFTHLCHVLLLSFIPASFAADNVCKPYSESPCQCRTDSGTVVNLEPLIKSADTPLFKDVSGPNGNFYSYNPCQDFTEEGCANVAACQKDGSGAFHSLGNQSSVQFIGDPLSSDSVNQLNFTYTSPPDATQSFTRQAVVALRCIYDKTPKFTVVGEEKVNQTFSRYNFILETDLVCFGSSGLSTGSVLLIIFFVFALIYLIGGVLVMRFMRGARGVEQIPNLEFWSDLPVLIKEGIAFTMGGCKVDRTYDQI